MRLEQSVLRAELAVAEGAISDDPLRDLAAARERAARFRRHGSENGGWLPVRVGILRKDVCFLSTSVLCSVVV